jgi:hypothetical protein
MGARGHEKAPGHQDRHGQAAPCCSRCFQVFPTTLREPVKGLIRIYYTIQGRMQEKSGRGG